MTEMCKINPFAIDAPDLVILLEIALILRRGAGLSPISKEFVSPDYPQTRNATDETCRPYVAAANREHMVDTRIRASKPNYVL